MTTVYLLQHTKSTLISDGDTVPETLGIFTTYQSAWTCLEQHAAYLGIPLDLSVADMGVILFDDGLGDDYYMGGYSIEEFTLDQVLEFS